MYIRISSLIVLFYFILATSFFFLMGDSMLNEETPIQFIADSATYEKAAYDLRELTSHELIIYNPNYFGMISILNLLNCNRWGVFGLNLFVFALSLTIIFRAVPLDRKIFVVLLLINPMTFSSLLAINKEIYSLLTIALLIYAINRRSIIAWLGCLVISFLVRWQISLFVMVCALLISPLNILRSHRLVILFVFIIAISIAYYAVANSFFSNVREVAETGGDEWEGTGLWGWLLDIQFSGGYFIVFPLKALHSMFGILVYIKKIINPPEFYNYVVVMLHSLTLLSVMVYALLRKKLRLRSDTFYIAIIYLLIFALTPIYAPRYFYPVFVLLCLLVSEKSNLQNNALRFDRAYNKACPLPC